MFRGILRTVAFGSHKMNQTTTCRNLALQNLDFLLCFLRLLRLPQIPGGSPVNRSPCLAGCDGSPVQATRLHINSIAGRLDHIPGTSSTNSLRAIPNSIPPCHAGL